jgi:hypothetical protein
MGTLAKLTEKFQRQKLAEILAQCSEQQQIFFNERIFPKRLFPNGVPLNKLEMAYDLCERTVMENTKFPERVCMGEQPDKVCVCGKTSIGICPRCGQNMGGKTKCV